MIDDTDLDTPAPAPPLSARTAGLRVELADVPPIRHHRRRRLAGPRITWHALAVYFLPHLTLAGVITLAVLLLRGALT